MSEMDVCAATIRPAFVAVSLAANPVAFGDIAALFCKAGVVVG
jgi:hypothetical protein